MIDYCCNFLIQKLNEFSCFFMQIKSFVVQIFNSVWLCSLFSMPDKLIKNQILLPILPVLIIHKLSYFCTTIYKSTC